MNKYIKTISISLSCILVFSFTLLGCGSRSKNTSSTAKSIDLQELSTKIESSGGKFPDMSTYSTSDKDAEDWFHYLCDFDYSKVEDYFISYSSNGTAEEVFLIKLRNSDDSTCAELSLRNRVNARTATFDQYLPKEVAKLRNATITSNDNYVALLICPDQYNAKNTFQNAFSTNK